MEKAKADPHVPKLLAIALALLTACAGGTGDDSGDDVATPIDAQFDPRPDAMPPNPMPGPLGITCTPDPENPEGPGDCPDGYTCLDLDDGSGPWCSRVCTGQADTTCGDDYDGPGRAYCFWTISFEGGSTDVPYCGVICADVPGGPNFCEATCDGTCPGSMACTAGPLAEGVTGCQ